MVENTNESKTASSVDFVNIKKYIGVASINVVAINPNNAKLRSFGWTIPDGAEEPKYVTETVKDGKVTKSHRMRFLVQIQDLDEKPVIALDFWLRPEVQVNSEGTKCKIIDSFGRTAWATKNDLSTHSIPQYSNGPAEIGSDYKPCHPGQEEIVAFLLKYLNVTPLSIFSREKQEWVASKNPGKLTIDDWGKLCSGDVSEVAEYIALRPKNRVKVILGVRTSPDNKTYQTFLSGGAKDNAYIGNGALPDKNTGEYASAKRGIDRFFEGRTTPPPVSYSAHPVMEWKETASSVVDYSPSFTESVFPGASDGMSGMPVDDLPFD